MAASARKHIGSVQSLLSFNDDAEANAIVGLDVRELTIQLPGPVPVPALRRCLGLAANVVNLVLLLPFDTPLTLLTTSRLPQLRSFKTNLPHGHVVPFVILAAGLDILSIGACGRHPNDKDCPLVLADLKYIRTIECPAACAIHITPLLLDHLTITDCSVVGIPQALKPFHLQMMVYLSVDFDPNDYDLLQSIVPGMTSLRRLKLLEKPLATRRGSHSRRAWNDVASWSRLLLKLPWLQELSLRTAAAFVRSPGDLQYEAKTLLGWTEGPKRQHTQRHHPRLNLIRVWYRCRESRNGVITHWSKHTGTWTNTLLMRDPLRNTLF